MISKVTEQDLFEALAKEISPSELQPGEILMSDLVAMTGLSRAAIHSRMAILISQKRVSARKEYFWHKGQRRCQWAFSWVNPERELKKKTRTTKVRVSKPSKTVIKFAEVLRKAKPGAELVQ